MAIDASILTKIIPVLLISFAIYFVFSPKLGITNTKRKIPYWVFASLACPVLGFYDGFLVQAQVPSWPWLLWCCWVLIWYRQLRMQNY